MLEYMSLYHDMFPSLIYIVIVYMNIHNSDTNDSDQEVYQLSPNITLPLSRFYDCLFLSVRSTYMVNSLSCELNDTHHLPIVALNCLCGTLRFNSFPQDNGFSSDKLQGAELHKMSMVDVHHECDEIKQNKTKTKNPNKQTNKKPGYKYCLQF